MDDDDENPGSHPATSSSYHDDLPDDLASVLESEFDEEDRQQQMNQIANLMGPLYNDYTRAFAWLADKDRLDRIIYTARHTPKGQTGMQCMFVFWAFKRLGLEWKSLVRRPRSSGTSETTGSGSRGDSLEYPGTAAPRSETQKDSCKKRDNWQCIITGCPVIDVAHLYPISMTGMRPTSDPRNVWVVLRHFWSEERVARWEQALFPGTGNHIDTCSNMLCLQPTAHVIFDKAAFALKPISLSDDQRRLVLQFFWLRRGECGQDLAARPSLRTRLRIGPDGAGLHDEWDFTGSSEVSRLICSGDEVVMTTDDPVNRPLPNYSILEMHWFLQRVSAIAGAADIYDDFDEDDSFGLEVPASVGVTSDNETVMDGAFTLL